MDVGGAGERPGQLGGEEGVARGGVGDAPQGPGRATKDDGQGRPERAPAGEPQADHLERTEELREGEGRERGGREPRRRGAPGGARHRERQIHAQRPRRRARPRCALHRGAEKLDHPILCARPLDAER